MLAGLERLFGESPAPALLVITLLALATLWLIDRTIALRFPLWVATVVTIGVAFVLLVAEFLTKQSLTTDLVGSSTQPIPTPPTTISTSASWNHFAVGSPAAPSSLDSPKPGMSRTGAK